MDLTYAKALDYVLNELDIAETQGYTDHKGNLQLTAHYGMILLTATTEFKISKKEVDLISSKLLEDGMIYVHPETDSYRMTFKGKDFLKEGGYIKKRENVILLANRTNRNETMLRNYNLILAVGTVGLVVVEVLLHYPDLWKNAKHLFSFFCNR